MCVCLCIYVRACLQTGEAIERIVTFQPPIPGPQNLNLTARTLAGRTFNLPATAYGVQPPLRLSHNQVRGRAPPADLCLRARVNGRHGY